MTEQKQNSAPEATPGDEMDVSRLWSEVDADEATDEEATPAPDDGDGEVQEPEKSGEEPAESAAFDWSAAPEPIRAAFEAERAKWEQDNKRLRGAQSGLQRRLDAITRAPAPKPEPKAEKAEGEGEDDLRTLQEEYPEIAGPVLKRLQAMQERLDGVLRTEESRAEAVRQAEAAEADVQNGELLSLHPDFYDVLTQRADEFNQWIADEAPVRFARIVEANRTGIKDAAASAEVYRAFRKHIGLDKQPAPPAQPQQSDRRQRQLASTAAPRTGSRPAASGIPDDGDPKALWNAIEV